MENNLENKSKFFALYWGFKCLRNELLNDNIPALKVDISDCKGLPQQYLELTPISHISDEDRHEVSGYLATSIDEYGCEYSSVGLVEWRVYDADYLRSRGYALPWMGLSVEQLVEYGWVKLNKG